MSDADHDLYREKFEKFRADFIARNGLEHTPGSYGHRHIDATITGEHVADALTRLIHLWGDSGRVYNEAVDEAFDEHLPGNADFGDRLRRLGIDLAAAGQAIVDDEEEEVQRDV